MPPPAPGIATRIARAAPAGLLLLFTLATFGPWQLNFPDSDLDTSWMLALHHAFLQRLHFGSEVVFTYGPLGFIMQGYHPGTFPLTVAGWTLIAVAFFAGLHRLATRTVRRRWLGWAWMALIIALCGAEVPAIEDVRATGLAWIFVLLHFQDDDRPISAARVLAVAALALISLGKFTMLLIGTAVILAVCIDELRRRRPPWIGAIWVGLMLVLWLATGQRLGDVLPHLRYSQELTSGFAPAMGRSTVTEGRDVLLFLCCAALFIAAFATVRMAAILPVRAPARDLLRTRSPLWPGLIVLCLLGLILLAVFKIGYVRHDEHEAISSTVLLVLALISFAVLWTAPETPAPGKALLRTGRGLAIAMLLASTLLCWYSHSRWTARGTPGHLFGTLAATPGRLGSALAWAVGRSDLPRQYELRLERIRGRGSIPLPSGSVDSYDSTQGLLVAHGLDYRPRLVVQGYITYTPALARLNADFLAGPRAPDWILFTPGTIDARYPAQDEALSWPQLLTRYDLVDATSGPLLLRRSQNPRSYSLVQAGAAINARIGDWINVPALAEPLWVSIDLRPTPAGKLLGLLYKPPPVFMDVKLRGAAAGAIEQYRLVPALLEQGFLLSPLIANSTEFAMLSSTAATANNPPRVERFRIVVGTDGGSGTGAYDENVAVSFSELKFPRNDWSAAPGFAQRVRFSELVGALRLIGADRQPQLVPGPDGRPVLLTPGNTQVLAPVKTGATQMRVEFGLLMGPQQNAPAPPSAPTPELRVYAAIVNGRDIRAQPLWSGRLDPPTASGDSPAAQSDVITLPSPPPTHVILETVQPAAGTLHNAYWADVEFR